MANPASPGHTLAAALRESESLGGLLQRVQASRDRLAAVAALLPAGLAAEIRPGPLDDTAWVLLVGHAAAAAKLRQLLPALQAELARLGFVERPLKVKVLPRAGSDRIAP